MSSEKKGVLCEECGQGPFKSMAGLAGHLQFQHGLKPGKGLAGVTAEQLVKGQEDLAERVGNLEAVVSEVEAIVSKAGELVERMAKQVPERLDKVLAAHRERFEKALSVLREDQAKQVKQVLEQVELLRRRVYEGPIHLRE